MTTRRVCTEEEPRPCGGIAEHPQTDGRSAQAPRRVMAWPTEAYQPLRRERGDTVVQHWLDGLTRGTAEPRTEEGMLSIMRRGHTYQVRYASSDPYAMDRLPYQCADEATLVAWLRQCGLDAWALQQAMATVRKGGSAILPVVLEVAQIHADFPLPQAAHA